MKDSFLTIASEVEGVYKNKGSKFLAFAFPVISENEIKERLDYFRKKYFDARHHCYAYRLGPDGAQFRANDDGEPTNSAGKPILGQIIAYDLTNIMVVVVRYFGGILLGVGGLIQAYKQSTANALENAEIITDIVSEIYRLHFDYPDMNQVLKMIKDMKLEHFEQDFNINCSIKVKIRMSLVEQMKNRSESISSLNMVKIA